MTRSRSTTCRSPCDRGGHRLPRPQRCRQVDDDAHDPGTGPAHVRQRAGQRASVRPLAPAAERDRGVARRQERPRGPHGPCPPAGAGAQQRREPVCSRRQAHTAEHAQGSAASWRDPRQDGVLPDVYIDLGQTAENVARLRGIQGFCSPRTNPVGQPSPGAGWWSPTTGPLRVRSRSPPVRLGISWMPSWSPPPLTVGAAAASGAGGGHIGRPSWTFL